MSSLGIQLKQHQERKRKTINKIVDAAHVSMLGMFVTLVGFLAVICSHNLH